jgi:hypothetical protein
VLLDAAKSALLQRADSSESSSPSESCQEVPRLGSPFARGKELDPVLPYCWDAEPLSEVFVKIEVGGDVAEANQPVFGSLGFPLEMTA